MPLINHCVTAFPPHYYSQDQLIEQFRNLWSSKFHNFDRIEQFHRNVLVGGRHLALPLEKYKDLEGFGDRNNAFIAAALEVTTRALSNLFEQSGVSAQDISLICSTTVTGLMVPSLDARLMNKFSFRSETKRLPIFGLGCLAGVAGLNRVADYLKGHPTEAAILVAVELCSLTVQLQDLGIANLVSSGLFGDGAAAVLMVGDQHPLAKKSKLKFVGELSCFFPNSERVMGWDFIDTGFKVVLGPEVPDIVSKHVPSAVEKIKSLAGRENSPIEFYVAHPGGPKVLESMAECLGLGPNALELSWKGLKEYGNMSSVSALYVLGETLKKLPAPKSLGLMVAMGPAFCAEFGLWEVHG